MDPPNTTINSFSLIINHFGHKKPRQFLNTGNFFLQKYPKYNSHKTDINENMTNNQIATDKYFNGKRSHGKNVKRKKKKEGHNSFTKEMQYEQMKSSEYIKKHKKRKRTTFDIVKNNYFENGSELFLNTPVKYKKHKIQKKKKKQFMPNKICEKSKKVFEQETSPTCLTNYSTKSFDNFTNIYAANNCNQSNPYEHHKTNMNHSVYNNTITKCNKGHNTYNYDVLDNNYEPDEKNDSDLFFIDISGNNRDCSSNRKIEHYALNSTFPKKNHDVNRSKYSMSHIRENSVTENSNTINVPSYSHTKIGEKETNVSPIKQNKKIKKRYYEITQSDNFNLKNNEHSKLNTSLVCSENETSCYLSPKKRKRSKTEEEMAKTDYYFESTPIKRIKKLQEDDLSVQLTSELILKDEIKSGNEIIDSFSINISEGEYKKKKKNKHKIEEREMYIQKNSCDDVENSLNSESLPIESINNLKEEDTSFPLTSGLILQYDLTSSNENIDSSISISECQYKKKQKKKCETKENIDSSISISEGQYKKKKKKTCETKEREINIQKNSCDDQNLLNGECMPIERINNLKEEETSFPLTSRLIQQYDSTSSNENIDSSVSISESQYKKKKKKKCETKENIDSSISISEGQYKKKKKKTCETKEREINIQKNSCDDVQNSLNGESMPIERINNLKEEDTSFPLTSRLIQQYDSTSSNENIDSSVSISESQYKKKKKKKCETKENIDSSISISKGVYKKKKEKTCKTKEREINIQKSICDGDNENSLNSLYSEADDGYKRVKTKKKKKKFQVDNISSHIQNDYQIPRIVSSSECEIIDSIIPSSKIVKSKKKRKVKEKLMTDDDLRPFEDVDTLNDFHEMSITHDSEQSVFGTPKVKKNKSCQAENIILEANQSISEEVDPLNYSDNNFEHNNTLEKKVEINKTKVSKPNTSNEDEKSTNNFEISHNLKSKKSVTEDTILSPKKKKSKKTKKGATQESFEKIEKHDGSKYLKDINVDNSNIGKTLELSETDVSKCNTTIDDSSNNSEIISHDLNSEKPVIEEVILSHKKKKTKKDTTQESSENIEKHNGSKYLKEINVDNTNIGKKLDLSKTDVSKCNTTTDDFSDNSEIISHDLKSKKPVTEEVILSHKRKKTKKDTTQESPEKIEKHNGSKYLKEINVDNTNIGKKLELNKTDVSKCNTTIDDFSDNSEIISHDLKSMKSVTEEIILSPKKKKTKKTKDDTSQDSLQKIEKQHGAKYLKEKNFDNSNIIGKALELSKTDVPKCNTTIDNSFNNFEEIISHDLKSKISITEEIILSPKKKKSNKTKKDITRGSSQRIEKEHDCKYSKEKIFDNSNIIGETLQLSKTDVSKCNTNIDDSSTNSEIISSDFKSNKSVTQEIALSPKKKTTADTIPESSQKMGKHRERSVKNGEYTQKDEENKRKIKQWFTEHVYTDSEESEEDNDKSETYLAEELSNPEIIREEKEKLRELSVILPFQVCPLHAILTRTTDPPKDQIKKIKNLNLPVKTGIFSQDEDNKIMENWKQFCKEYNIAPIPSLFMKFPRRMKQSEKVNVLRYIGHGLDNRMLYRIYIRFRLLLQKRNLKTGRYTPKEDKAILDFMRRTKSPHAFLDLGAMLNRSRSSVEIRYIRLLKGSLKRINYNNPEMADKFVKALMKVAKCNKIKKLKHREFTDEEWNKLSESLDGISTKSLRRAWKVTIHPRLFSKESNYTEVKEDLVHLLHDRKETDWKTVDWKEIAKYFKGMNAAKLYMMFKQTVHYHVPKSKRDNIKEVVDYLKSNLHLLYRPRKLKKFVMKDGRITYENDKEVQM